MIIGIPPVVLDFGRGGVFPMGGPVWLVAART